MSGNIYRKSKAQFPGTVIYRQQALQQIVSTIGFKW